MLKMAAALLCAYELGALATGRYPTLTALSGKHPWLGDALQDALAIHLRHQPIGGRP